MKKITTLIIVVALAISLVGCDALQRKFTRKKKKKAKRPRIYQVKKYELVPTPELYNKHYVYWQTWSGEIIELLGQNHKKDVRCIEEIVGQLNDMQNILVEPKVSELQKHIDRMEDVQDTIKRGGLSFATQASVKQKLEREDRAIKREFITSKVKSYIKESFEDEATGPGVELDGRSDQ